MRALFHLRIFFSFLESICQTRRMTGKERGSEETVEGRKEHSLRREKNVRFAGERITDKKKKKNIWVRKIIGI